MNKILSRIFLLTSRYVQIRHQPIIRHEIIFGKAPTKKKPSITMTQIFIERLKKNLHCKSSRFQNDFSLFQEKNLFHSSLAQHQPWFPFCIKNFPEPESDLKCNQTTSKPHIAIFHFNPRSTELHWKANKTQNVTRESPVKFKCIYMREVYLRRAPMLRFFVCWLKAICLKISANKCEQMFYAILSPTIV